MAVNYLALWLHEPLQKNMELLTFPFALILGQKHGGSLIKPNHATCNEIFWIKTFLH